MKRSIYLLVTVAGLAVASAAMAQNPAASPLNSGNVRTPSQAVPNAGQTSAGPIDQGTVGAPSSTGTVVAPPAGTGAPAASPLNSGNARTPNQAVPNTGQTSGGTRQ